MCNKDLRGREKKYKTKIFLEKEWRVEIERAFNAKGI